MKTPELFHVISTIREYRGCNGLRMYWFNAAFTRPDLPYAALIEGYDQMASDLRVYPEYFLGELFTAEQVGALVGYLDRHHGDECVQTVSRAEMPIPGNMVAFGAIDIGGSEDFNRLCMEAEWTLPFKVWGYYDLRQQLEGPHAGRVNDDNLPF